MRVIIKTAMALALALLIGSAAWAATSDAKIGVVDYKRVIENAPRMQQYTQELDEFAQSLDTKMSLRAENAMLKADEIQELIDIKTKPKLTDADNTKIKALTDTAKTRGEELKKLQGTKDITSQQKSQLKELQDLRQRSVKAIDTVANDYRTQMQRKSRELSAKADAELRAAVSKVAAAKNLTTVLAKQTAKPDGSILEVMLLGGVDITEDVISKLDRKAP